MAEFVVLSVARYLERFIGEGYELGVHHEKNLRKLLSLLLALQPSIDDAERLQMKDEAARDWLRKLKNAAYDIENVLDDCTTQILISTKRGLVNAAYDVEEWHESVGQYSPLRSNESETRSLSTGKRKREYSPMSGCSYQTNPLVHSIMKKAKDILGSLDDLVRMKTGFREMAIEERKLQMEARCTTSYVEEEDVFGRDEDREKVIQSLLGGSNEEISLITIVGMAGIGKTTVTQLAYNDKSVVQHFEERLWVYVSQDFDMLRLTKALIQTATGKNIDLTELDPLQHRLSKVLNNKRVLIVLDDVWNEDIDKWEHLKFPFKACGKGSKILVTTRSEKVSLAMDATYLHLLTHLSGANAWLIFARRAFIGMCKEDHFTFEPIGRKIVKKCKGIPILVKTVSNMMRTKKRKCQWKCVLQSEIFDLPFVNKRVLPDLLLSYYDLNVTLKRCFSYCSMFPRDRSISCSDLTKIWVAEGFILGKGQKEMMEVAGQYFDDLVDKSLLGVFDKAEHWQTRRGEMHELAYGLARFVAGCDGFSSICKNDRLDEIPDEARHAFLICKEFNSAKDVALSIRKALHRAKNLRTFKLQTAQRLVLPPDLFDRVDSLRVLDMSYSQIHNLPKSVQKLRRLRHIFLCDSGIAWLPKTFGPLLHLQTLDAEECTELNNLPCDLPQLLRLKHLKIFGTDSLGWLPKHIGQLSRLETLSNFVVQDEDGHRIEELQNLNSLVGHLSITSLEKVRNQREAIESQICEKPKLKSLKLGWTFNEHADGKGTKSIFDCLRPHSNLKMLSIWSYPGIMFPKWMLDSSLCNLVTLELLYCINCEHLPSLGKLPLLEHLAMVEFPAVKCVGYEFYGTVENAFPRLETLRISGFVNLEEWLEMDGAMPMLLNLTITSLPKLKQFPFPSLRKLKSLDISCVSMETMPAFSDLKSLRMGIDHDPRAFQNVLGHIPSETLEELIFCIPREVTSLEEYALQCFRGLVKLTLLDCENLECLPESIRCLTKLNLLQISLCPRSLTDRCMKEKGEDWDKISHIPNIRVGRFVIRESEQFNKDEDLDE